jgi:membrane-associated phospholipid phosphatase
MELYQHPLKYWLFLLTFTFITAIEAQNSLLSTNQESFFSKAAKKKNDWIYPASLAIGYSTGIYMCYRFWDPGIQKISQQNKTKFKSFIADGVANLGLGKYQTLGLAGTSIFAFAGGDKKLQKTVIIWAGSLLINSVATDQLKKTFQRHRPSSRDSHNSFDWRKGPKLNVSFPSAHTSNAFTTATVFAIMYKDKKWVSPVAYTLASLVGLSRIYNNAHWGSDVFAGAAVGFLSAKAMNSLYKLSGKRITFLPQVTMGHCAIDIIYPF